MNRTALRFKKPLLAFGLSFLFCSGFAIAPAGVAAVHAASAQPEDLQTFSGKIMSQNGDRYILREDSSDMWYHLDDQQQASKYLGKTVQITGTLDGRSDMIHIRNIVEDKS
jgi:uncharacterized protein YdeI (BOF family)